MVVAQHGAVGRTRLSQVGTARAEQHARAGDGVGQALRVGDAVTVAVAAGHRPRRRDELHRADGAVEDGVAVEGPAVGVGDAGGAARAVERDADDARAGDAARVEDVATEACVVALDPTDGAEQGPVDAAPGLDAAEHAGRALVGRDGHRGYAVGVQTDRGERVDGRDRTREPRRDVHSGVVLVKVW